MKASQLFKHAFILLIIIGFLDFFANTFYLYWTIWWSDLLLHFLSGVCVAMGGISVWFFIFSKKETNILETLFVGMVWVVLVGLVWEIFELHFGATFLSDGQIYVVDTISDLLMDISGGFLGGVYAIKLLKRD